VVIGVFENSQNPNLDLAETAKQQGFEVRTFPCNGRFDKGTIKVIRECIDGADVGVLHSHNYKSNFYAWKAIKNSNNGVRWVVTNHGRRYGAKLLVYNCLDAFIVRGADRVVAVSEEICRKMKRLGVREERLCVIDNGVNLNRSPANREPDSIKTSLGIKKDAKVIGTVGALTKEKGHVYLLKAVASVTKDSPEAVFLVVGDGKERSSLEKIGLELGIGNNVIFTGMRKDVPDILSILDVFVLPSLNEGLPMALLEAQAARVPTISTRVGAIPNVMEDGTTGILIPPKDPEAIARAINRVLSDRDTAIKMAEKGFEKVRDHFSSEIMASKYISLYNEVIQGTGCRV
jgi:glycosyltransferase involved in cell wall biosynthesis